MKKNTFYNSFLFCVSDNTFCLWKNNELCTQDELAGSDSGPRAFFIHSMNLNASSQRSVLVMDWQESTALLNFSLSPRFLLKFALIVSASIFPSFIYVHRVMIYAIILFVLENHLNCNWKWNGQMNLRHRLFHKCRRPNT